MNEDAMFEGINSSIPFRLKSECESDLLKMKANSNSDEYESDSLNRSSLNFSRASFVEIQSKPDPTRDSKNTTNCSMICSEAPLKEMRQLDSKVPHKPKISLNKPKQQRNKKGKSDLLKRSKSHVPEEEYDTVIIEEEYHVTTKNKDKKLPLKKAQTLFPGRY